MKILGKFLVVFTVISILSFGISSSVYADSHNIAPVSINPDKSSYGTGETILFSGYVKDYNPDDGIGVTVMIVSPNGSIVAVSQMTPDTDGNFSTNVIASGMIKEVGEYTVKVTYGPQSNQSIFEFVGGEGGVQAAPAQAAPAPELEMEVEPSMDTEPEPVMASSEPVCGKGTVLKDGLCVVEEKKKGGGCLIATAAYGSEMAPQIQFLREIRDNTVLQTESGSAFLAGFNQFYYSFSPTVADYERENPAFKETVKLALTPMLTSLTILNYVDIDSESEMLGYGIGIILLNIGMYFVVPVLVIMKIKKRK